MLNVKYVIHHLKLSKLYLKHFVFDKMIAIRSFKPRIPVDPQEHSIHVAKHIPSHK